MPFRKTLMGQTGVHYFCMDNFGMLPVRSVLVSMLNTNDLQNQQRKGTVTGTCRIRHRNKYDAQIYLVFLGTMR